MRLSLEESTYRVEMVVYYKVFKQREVSQKREREKESSSSGSRGSLREQNSSSFSGPSDSN